MIPFLTYFGIFGFLALLITLLIRDEIPTIPLIFALMMSVLVFLNIFLTMKNNRSLVDEVYDCSDFLLIKNRGEEDIVPLSNIININTSTGSINLNTSTRSKILTITLQLVKPSKFGTKISFLSPAAKPTSFWDTSTKSLIAEDLIIRVDQARSKRSA